MLRVFPDSSTLPNIRVVRIMCTGRMDASFILDAFLQGVDGILVGG